MRRCFGIVALLALGACDSGASAGDTDAETDAGSSGTSTSGGGPGGGATTNPGSGDASASGAASTSDGDTTGDSNGETGLPEGNGCCDPHQGGGCEEVGVEQCVCESLPQCCVFSWNAECAELAQTRCEATCESSGDTGSSGGDTGSDTSAGSDTATGACEEPVVLELGVGEASLSGNWVATVSDVGEGDIAVLMGQPAGAVTWDVEVPCEDTWFIWVRYWEQGNDDSYFVTVDGAPAQGAIFEGDCGGGGQGYGWRLLNERGDSPCVYVQDPWAPQWEAGAHELAFSYRESIALGRIVVTNDPEYAP